MIGVRRVDREFRRKTGLKLIQHRQFIRTRIAVHDENRLFRPTFGNSAPQFGGDFFPADDALVQGVRDGNERILLHEINGASEGIRTLDTHVGNVMLYQAELRSLPKARKNYGKSLEMQALFFPLGMVHSRVRQNKKERRRCCRQIVTIKVLSSQSKTA